jgi:hypothetical protein
MYSADSVDVVYITHDVTFMETRGKWKYGIVVLDQTI